MSGECKKLTDAYNSITTVELACLTLQVTGTRSAGGINIQGSVDGVNYIALPLIEDVAAGAGLASGLIIAAGIYRIPVIGLQVCRYVKNGSYSGTLAITARTDANVPPPFVIGL